MDNDMLKGYEKDTITYLNIAKRLYENSTHDHNNSKEQVLKEVQKNMEKANTSISYMELELCNEDPRNQKSYQKRIKKYRSELNNLGKHFDQQNLFLFDIDSNDSHDENLEETESHMMRDGNEETKSLLTKGGGSGNSKRNKLSLNVPLEKLKEILDKGKDSMEDMEKSHQTMIHSNETTIDINNQLDVGGRQPRRRSKMKRFVHIILCLIIIALILMIIVSLFYFFIFPLFSGEKEEDNKEEKE